MPLVETEEVIVQEKPLPQKEGKDLVGAEEGQNLEKDITDEEGMINQKRTQAEVEKRSRQGKGQVAEESPLTPVKEGEVKVKEKDIEINLQDNISFNLKIISI